MKNEFKIITLCVLLVLLAGCATGTPLDIVIPTRKPSIATTEYLGHLYTTNYANGIYHSLIDTKIEEAMIPLRDIELQGLMMVAKGEIELYRKLGDATSTGAWGLIGAGLLAVGWQIPRPQEKAKVIEALHATPPK